MTQIAAPALFTIDEIKRIQEDGDSCEGNRILPYSFAKEVSVARDARWIDHIKNQKPRAWICGDEVFTKWKSIEAMLLINPKLLVTPLFDCPAPSKDTPQLTEDEILGVWSGGSAGTRPALGKQKILSFAQELFNLFWKKQNSA